MNARRGQIVFRAPDPKRDGAQNQQISRRASLHEVRQVHALRELSLVR